MSKKFNELSYLKKEKKTHNNVTGLHTFIHRQRERERERDTHTHTQHPIGHGAECLSVVFQGHCCDAHFLLLGQQQQRNAGLIPG